MRLNQFGFLYAKKWKWKRESSEENKVLYIERNLFLPSRVWVFNIPGHNMLKFSRKLSHRNTFRGAVDTWPLGSEKFGDISGSFSDTPCNNSWTPLPEGSAESKIMIHSNENALSIQCIEINFIFYLILSTITLWLFLYMLHWNTLNFIWIYARDKVTKSLFVFLFKGSGRFKGSAWAYITRYSSFLFRNMITLIEEFWLFWDKLTGLKLN